MLSLLIDLLKTDRIRVEEHREPTDGRSPLSQGLSLASPADDL